VSLVKHVECYFSAILQLLLFTFNVQSVN